MDDIAPKLLEQIQSDFQSRFDKSGKIARLYARIRDGTATYKEADAFAVETGEILAAVFKDNLSSDVLPDGKLYYNIAERILRPTLGYNYELVADVSVDIQNILNKTAGIGIKAVRPEINQDRVQGIIDIASGREQYDDVAYILGEAVVNFTQSVVTDAVKKNADFQYRSGLSPKIRRTATGKCCEWCGRLEGVYDYAEVSDTGNDVFRRHKHCRCLVEYDPGEGKLQNVHSKRWKTQEEYDKIKTRKTVGLIAGDDAIKQNIRERIIPQQNIEKIADRQQIHRVGTKMYEQRKSSLESKGQYGPSYITISDEEVLELVREYSGKGEIKYDRKGNWNQQETIVTNDKIIGVVFNNQTGKSAATSVFKIHYGKDGIHIVPDYPSKKR